MEVESILAGALQKLFERYGPFNPFKNYGELARDLGKILDSEVVVLTRKEHGELLFESGQFRKIKSYIEDYKSMKPDKTQERLRKEREGDLRR